MALPLLLLFATANSDRSESIGGSKMSGCAAHLVAEIDRESFAADRPAQAAALLGSGISHGRISYQRFSSNATTASAASSALIAVVSILSSGASGGS